MTTSEVSYEFSTGFCTFLVTTSSFPYTSSWSWRTGFFGTISLSFVSGTSCRFYTVGSIWVTPLVDSLAIYIWGTKVSWTSGEWLTFGVEVSTSPSFGTLGWIGYYRTVSLSSINWSHCWGGTSWLSCVPSTASGCLTIGEISNFGTNTLVCFLYVHGERET